MIPVTSLHTARLTVPMSGDPAQRVTVQQDDSGRTLTFSAVSSVSEAEARQILRAFLQAARDAAQG